MTQQNLTSINIVLDRSGSMTPLTAETIAGFNKFLTEQKAVDGEATLTLATFASDYTLVHDFCELHSVAELTLGNYKTGGYTALLDALGRTIDATGARLASLPEEKRPAKVIFVVISDGQENYSRTFNREQVFEKITHQREKYNWEFVFLGCDQSQVSDAVKLGISASNSVAYVATGAGVSSAYTSISANTSSYRAGNAQQVNFFDQGNVQPVPPTPVVVIPNTDVKVDIK
jgi:Mg-chelatase subunit ChlD